MILTAEEILRKRYKLEGDRGELRIDNLVYIMNEYAKLHVNAALEAVYNNDKILKLEKYSEDWYISRPEVITSYPLENIK